MCPSMPDQTRYDMLTIDGKPLDREQWRADIWPLTDQARDAGKMKELRDKLRRGL